MRSEMCGIAAVLALERARRRRAGDKDAHRVGDASFSGAAPPPPPPLAGATSGAGADGAQVAATGATSPRVVPGARLASLAASSIHSRGPDIQGTHYVSTAREASDRGAELDTWHVHLTASVLHLRGDAPTAQPLLDDDGNALLWNGEVFGGPSIKVGGGSLV